ncbi:MAG: hypothetical protein KGZ81_16460 [Flavobacteriales bacterium]|nr:hypothetical protein [Flavobacteriales bacterium]MBS4042183.1 hypothetical protein [Flavobacteriales bacterium]
MDKKNELSEFAAREPSLGYFYQIRYSLFLLLSNRAIQNPLLRIESLDDIEIQSPDKTEIFQTKLKLKSKASLTNSSVDFWKTIRVWADNINNNRVEPEKTIFTLISTEEVSNDSFLKVIRDELKSDVTISSLISQMDTIATTSTNATNKKAYDEYLKLSIDNKKSLIKNIHIIDAASDIAQITDKLKSELAYSAPYNQIDSFLEILEGWWFQIAIEHLIGNKDCINSKELQSKVSSIRDSFSQDNLPNHFGKQLEISDQEVKNFKDKTYIKQLEIISIKLSSNTAKRAISDFRRAFQQRSKWLRLELLSPDEQIEYDEKLYDYWKNLFDIIQDECAEKEIEQIREIGNKFYLNQFAKTCPPVKIREKFNEDYLTRGSYQILSDSKRIGWHPNFKDLL